MKSASRLIASAAALLLSGCFVSETPLFESISQRARPLAAGEYDVCSGSTEDEAVECSPMTVALTEDGRYTFHVEDDLVTAYFVGVDDDDYAVQMDDGGGDGDYHYYWGRSDGGSLTLVMLWCDDLPRALVDQLVADGLVETDETYSTCTAKNVEAVMIAVRSYAAGEVADQNWVKFTPTALEE